MRAIFHKTLTSEAAKVLRNAVGLASRRGHAQATPLHVAAMLVGCDTGLLRQACLHSHGAAVLPLQWRALEVCLNVALNRLPGAAVHQGGPPSLSNALIAALKRAQAHQRRGCIEQQQAQPVMGVRVEMEQLVISILDDPSVSRVMREAGFYTTHVKTSVEDKLGSSNPATNLPSLVGHRHREYRGIQHENYAKSVDLCFLKPPAAPTESISRDTKSLVDILVSPNTANTVIVGDEVLYTQSIIGELMVRIESGNVPDRLKNVQFITPEIFSCIRLDNRDDVQRKLADLNRILTSCCKNGGVLVYVGDLRWTVETAEIYNSSSYYSYSGVDDVIVEVGRMLEYYGDKVCLVGTASNATMMQCKTRQPCLECEWKLQALNVSGGGLHFSLYSSALGEDAKMDKSGHVFLSNTIGFNKANASTSEDDMEKFNCCHDCSSKFDSKACISIATLSNSTGRKEASTNIQFPSWLREYQKGYTCTQDPAFPQVFRSIEMVTDLRVKWNQNSLLTNEPQSQTLMQNQQDMNFSCNGNEYSPRLSANPTIKFLEEESASESAENRSIWEVETTLTLGRSSVFNDHDNNIIPNKRNRLNDHGLRAQNPKNCAEFVSPSVGNHIFC